MTILDGNGIHGATTNDPSIHPKGIKGRVDGSPNDAELGRNLTDVADVNLSLTTNFQDVSGLSHTLSTGVWALEYSVTMQIATGASAGNTSTGNVQITDDANTKIGNSLSIMQVSTIGAASQSLIQTLSKKIFLTVTDATKVVKVRARINQDGGTGTGTVFSTASGLDSTFTAQRIA